jgi:hypothetical protein
VTYQMSSIRYITNFSPMLQQLCYRHAYDNCRRG